MFSQKLWFVTIVSTLLLQCSASDESLSTLKTSSGRSAYLSAESQSSNTEITLDSFSKSDSSFAASGSEISQNDSSVVNTSDGISIQDSNYYSSSNSVSGSNSDIIATDGFISQTESNFETLSSTTAESDTSLTATQNGTVMSSMKSSSASTTSSSATTSRSVSGQFLDDSEADISFSDEGFPTFHSSYQTKSLDSIPDFPNSKFPSLESKPFSGPPNSKFPPNFPKFLNSLNNNSFQKYDSKNPYVPSGLFNSKPTSMNGTPVGPAGISTPLLPSASSKLPSPLSNSLLDSSINTEADNLLPIKPSPDSQFQNDILTVESSLGTPPTVPISDLPNSPIGLDDNLLINSPENDVPIEFHEDMATHTPGFHDSSANSHISLPLDSLPKSLENEILNESQPDMSSQISEFQDVSGIHPTPPSNLDIHSVSSDQTDIPDSFNTPVPLVSSTDMPLDNTPGPHVSSTDLIDDNLPIEVHALSDTPENFNEIDSPLAHIHPQQPYDKMKNSPIHDDILTPITPYDSNLHPYDHTSSTNQYPTQTVESMDTDQNGHISPNVLESMDLDQNGLISPEEILESSKPLSPSSTFSALDKTEQLEILDSPHLLQPGYDEDKINLPMNEEHLLPDKFSQIEQLSTPNEQFPSPPNIFGQSPSHQPNFGLPNPKIISPYDQFPTPHGTYLPNPPYTGINKPYFRPKYPLPFQYNFPTPKMSPYFAKYPLYSPYFKDDYFNHHPMVFPPNSFLYDKSILPPPYNYPGHFLHPSPPPHQIMPDLYNPSPLISSGNPLLNKPPYSYPNSPLNMPQRPYYKPKDWSEVPILKGSQYSPNTSSPLSPANLDSLLHNQPLTNLPADSTPLNIPQRPYYKPKDWSKMSISNGAQYSPNALSPLSPASLDSLSPNQPLTDMPTYSLLPELTDDSPSPDSLPIQPLLSSDSDRDLLPTVPDSAMFYSTPPNTPDLLSPDSLDLNNNFLLTTVDSSHLQHDLNPNSPYSSIDAEIFDILKQAYEQTTAEYQLSNSIYPQDISDNLDVMTDEELAFNFVILGSSPAALSALKTLSDTGKSILLIERGKLPPHVSHSLYYRPKILQSDYVRKIKSSAPHCDTEKILYVPNVLGEESSYDSNIWDYGVKSKYIKWGKIGNKWKWNNIIEYFTDGFDQPNTCSIPVNTEIENTKAIDAVTNIFNDAGLYRTDYQPGKRVEGLTVEPYLQENGENVILAEKIFQQLTNSPNIKLALGTTPERIVFDDFGKAIGVVIKPPNGKMITIPILDELIIGSNPVDTVQFLYQSGIGDHEQLQRLNIPTHINLPYVGKELIITPLHVGVIYLFPQGTLLSDTESDFAGTDYLFGKYQLPSALSIDYLKAALNIYGAPESNVIFNFRVFSKSMLERLKSYIEQLNHIDINIKDFLINLCQDNDLLLAVPQLTNVLSKGEIIIDNSNGILEALVDTGMYKSKRDITIMQKALKVLKSIAETEAFKSLNGKLVQIPVKQCGVPDFSTEYNRCSIRYLSLPNLHYCGGTIMGVSPLTSVVNEDLLIHGTKNVRIFGSSVVPYGTSADSSAVSSVIGNLGAHILIQNYLQ